MYKFVCAKYFENDTTSTGSVLTIMRKKYEAMDRLQDLIDEKVRPMRQWYEDDNTDDSDVVENRMSRSKSRMAKRLRARDRIERLKEMKKLDAEYTMDYL